MNPSHAYRVIPGGKPSARPLVLLHGSGGDENTLVPLAQELAPGASVLSPRGTVPIDDGFAFFHRRPDRSIDETDLLARLPVLVHLITAVGGQAGLSERPIAVGFSNGAIMAAALLAMHPSLLAGAVLFRPLSPFLARAYHRLNGTPVLILDGAKDSRRSPGDGARLAERLGEAGAVVTHHVLPVGHAITGEDKTIARNWISESVSAA